MNFKKLQAMQEELDNAILAEKAEMTAKERFNQTLVSLDVEIAEIANCSEHFKFWKDNKGKVDGDRFEKTGILIGGKPVYWDNINKQEVKYNQAHKLTLVEECSDALHFILSLANQGGETLKNRKIVCELYKSLEDCYKDVARIVNGGFELRVEMDRYKDKFLEYVIRLGITEKELEQAYYDKNEINYKRLREGY